MRIPESWMLAYLLNSLWQVPLLLAAGWIAARAVRPLGVLAEHRVWAVTLLFEGVLPACSVSSWAGISGTWLSGILRWLGWHSPGSGDAHVSVVMGPGTGVSALPFPVGLLSGVAMVYAALCVYFAARLVWRALHLRALRRDLGNLVLTGDAARIWQECATRFSAAHVALATSPRIFAPVTLGFRRKCILLPSRMIQCDPQDLRAVLAHELAHIHRNDFALNLAWELIAVPLSYHPAFRATRERLIETREMVCDDMAAIGGRRVYARSLLRLANLLVTGAPARIPHAIGMFDANTFDRRLMRLTEKRPEIRTVRRLATIAACAALAIVACGSAIALHIRVDGLQAMTGDAQPAAPIHVSSHIMQGQRISGAMPVYPPEAKKKRVQGTVLLDATIDKEGKVSELHVVSGPKMLRQSALDAVKTWLYKPYLLNGEPVEVRTTINVTYSLEK
jgi:TonB family protein